MNKISFLQITITAYIRIIEVQIVALDGTCNCQLSLRCQRHDIYKPDAITASLSLLFSINAKSIYN